MRTEWFEGLQPETPDQAIELARQCLQIAAGLVELIGDMAGADGQLVDVDDIAVDVLDHAGLLLGGSADLDVLGADLAIWLLICSSAADALLAYSTTSALCRCPSALARAFRRKVGASPSEWLKQGG